MNETEKKLLDKIDSMNNEKEVQEYIDTLYDFLNSYQKFIFRNK